MDNRGENSADEEEETAAIFTRALAGLKRRGSGLLLVGPEPAMRQACDRFLGDSTAEPRRHVFVRTNGTPHHAHAMADSSGTPDTNPNASNVKIIERAAATRSTTTAPNTRSRLDKTVLETDNLAELGIGISNAIDEFERESGTLSPGELRVCFDSLTPVVDEHDSESVFRFLHVLIGRIKTVNGMGHFHLPAEFDSTIVRTLLPVFDAAVEVRMSGSDVEQRWHLVQQDVTTQWLSL